ncbi:MAG: sulfatase-like hydrolase/transferase [Flavobacteriales bacterium]|nr:sulfatase-like hydrolase/transferase [Flavobacteriales bacterium]
MMRSCALCVLLGAAVPCVAQQPNILLVIADDLGLDPVPGYLPGPEKAAMPNLQALMAQGLTFDNVWVDPLCSPTRSTIITGRYGSRTGVLNPGDLSLLPTTEVTLHRYLTDLGSGYASCIIGKWHLGGTPPDPTYPNTMGVPHFAGLLSGAVADYSNWQLTVDGAVSQSTDYITTALTDRAIAWIDQQTSPWFCWLAYTAPHTPLHLPPAALHQQGALPDDAESIAADPLPYFLAMVESVDHELGRVLASLTPEERANTVVIFIGDNGTSGNVIQQPYIPQHAKGSLYEGGVHVPLVVAGPVVTRAGQREPALVNSTDLFCTIVELSGNALPSYEDSRSLVPLLAQPGLSVRSCLMAYVSQGTVSGHAIRDERWKLIIPDTGAERFFDLQTDPWESTELLATGLNTAQQQAYEQLQNACQQPTGFVAPASAQHFALLPDLATSGLLVQAPLAAPVQVHLYNATGALVRTRTVTAVLDIADLRPGLYLAHLAQGDRAQVLRFVKP